MAKEKIKKEKVKKESFLKGTHKEMKQVRWPSGKEVIKYSIATVFLVLFCVAFFVLIDLLSSFIKGLFV
ncbi:MAG: preprotein translocase subunit SecE [Bacilli bacterium]|nr:preprotein translocase subunit SecE [Bacilli bacterium]